MFQEKIEINKKIIKQQGVADERPALVAVLPVSHKEKEPAKFKNF